MNGLTLLRSALTQFRFAQKRSFGAAAVQLYDYSDDEDDNEYNMIRNQVQISESERSVSEKGVQWVFIGNPGAKKHLYAEKLSQLLQVPHISMGSLVRQELNPRSSLYKQIANAISEGKLVHEDVIFGLLSKRLEEGYCRGETGFILDGIPRNRMQAEILDQIADIDLVVNFKCSSDCWLKKHLGGSICIHCEASLAMQSPGSANLNWLMQQSQLKPLIAEDVQKEKLQLYAEQKKPLEDYYRERKKLIDFQVASGPKDTWQGLLSALHLKHMNAVSSSNKLTV